ncbi:MAG TPA: PAS domain S-box protein [Candidatus Omnitrophota bacterium]|nr:PAS domain S-box protein [Candidatus Omnitrophota bacterium]
MKRYLVAVAAAGAGISFTGVAYYYALELMYKHNQTGFSVMATREFPLFVLMAGMLVTVLFTMLLLSAFGRSQQSRKFVIERNSDLNTLNEKLHGELLQRTLVENKLQANEEKFRSLIDNIPDVIWTVDRQGRVIFVSDNIRTIFGYAPKDIYARPDSWFGVIFPDDENRVRQAYEALFNENKRLDIEYRIYRPDKTLVWLHCRSVSTYVQGNISYADGLITDITERRNSEEKFMQLYEAVDQSPSIVLITDAERRIQYVNPQFSLVTGYSREEAVGNTPQLLKSGEQDDSYYAELNKTVTSGRTWEGVFRNKRKDGQLYWEAARISPLRNARQELIGYIKVSEDITERKRMEDELKKASDFNETIVRLLPVGMDIVDLQGTILYMNQKFVSLFGDDIKGKHCWEVYKDNKKPCEDCALQSRIEPGQIKTIEVNGVCGGRSFQITHMGMVFENKPAVMEIFIDITERKRLEQLKDEFVSTVSHELRTPLSITKEGISLVLDRIPGALNQKQEHILSTAKDNTERLARIINDLLDISKIESGRVFLRPELIDMVSLVTKTIASLEPMAIEKKLQLVAHFSQRTIEARIDPDRIIQVFNNLIWNSLKFTHKGSITVTVNDAGDHLDCCVADTGIGIEEKDLPNLFEKFIQFGRVEGGGDRGTGLGLAIVKGIIEMHKGTIRIESVAGQGTKVLFSLPKQ